MKWPPELVLPAIKDVAWPILTEFLRPDCCIAATRIGIDVLARFGIHGLPMPTCAMAQNSAFKKWNDAGGEGEAPSDARFVIIDSERQRENGFPGHLIITGKIRGINFVLDLSAPQFHRPEKNILVPEPVLLCLPRAWDKDESLSLPLDNDGLLSYEYHPTPDIDWTYSRDWSIPGSRRHWFEHIKGRIIEAAEEKVSERKRSPRDLVRQPLRQP